MFGTVPKSTSNDASKSWVWNHCYMSNATFQSYSRRVVVGSFLDIDDMMCCWDVNGCSLKLMQMDTYVQG
jgi:hypothetical protein